ncbi:MAG: hypothetical protein HUJ68_12525 [Clostridia bacterium]|nr:hypothetical protein [Clostridia bacterium]
MKVFVVERWSELQEMNIVEAVCTEKVAIEKYGYKPEEKDELNSFFNDRLTISEFEIEGM